MLPLIEEWASCPGCGRAPQAEGHGAPGIRALHQIPNSKSLVRSVYLALLGCETCGLVYTSPRPDSAAAARYYDASNEKGWTRQIPSDDSAKMTRKHAAAASALAPVLRPAGREPRRALDYGCGAGAMLDVLQEAGWETVGVEPGRIRTYASRRHQIVETIPHGTPFDLVIVHHVLEHVVDVRSLLRELHAAAAPEAQVLIGVPSLAAVPVTGDFKYACSALHINSFTGESLGNVLRMNGWTPFTAAAQPHRGRLIMYGRRVDAPVPPVPAALDVAIEALRTYGQRLDQRGEFVVCPLDWSEAGEAPPRTGERAEPAGPALARDSVGLPALRAGGTP